MTRALLSLDQKVFKEYIARLRKAQNYQIRITKDAASNASVRYMREQFENIRSNLVAEVKNLLTKNDDLF